MMHQPGDAVTAQRPPGQMVLVTTAHWDAPTGTLQRYQRVARKLQAPWRKVGPPIDVSVGRSGLGWRTDQGAEPPPKGAPMKREGDGRAPAGILHLGDLWGYSKAPPKGVSWPYHPAHPADRCIDDVNAALYGRITRQGPEGPAWTSAELMRRNDSLYKWLLVVTYNMEAPIKGAGSCIFLHLWDRPFAPTAGCTAMSEASLVELALWLKKDQDPVLVQLPKDLLEAYKSRWDLP